MPLKEKKPRNMVQLLFVSVIFVFFTAGALSCDTDEDCALAGNCNSGTCDCFTGWTGDNCTSLNFDEASRQDGVHEDGTATWGGSPIFNPATNQYYLFVSRMANGKALLNEVCSLYSLNCSTSRL